MKIVKTWKINMNPEYRGFRCANCQTYMKKAWHYSLSEGGYNTPVHFCPDCSLKFSAILGKTGIYKNFTCDKCGKKMQKAYHVWKKKGKTLEENHFCKECGADMGLGMNIKGVIYDLDGTIISTAKLHRAGWARAGKKFGIKISAEMLLNQSGISNAAAAKMMLPYDQRYMSKEFIADKSEYVMENADKIKSFPAAIKTIDELIGAGFKVWVCTSARKGFVKKTLKSLKPLKEALKKNIVWREMYKEEKPSSQALDLTIDKMGLNREDVCYIGDAYADYRTAKAAKIRFMYFCPSDGNRDPRIPKYVPIMHSHKNTFELLKCF